MQKEIAAVTSMTTKDNAYLVVIFTDGSIAWNTHPSGAWQVGIPVPGMPASSVNPPKRGTMG